MKIFTILITGLLLSGLLYIGDRGTDSLPPLGKFLHPSLGFWQNAENVHNARDLYLEDAPVQASIFIDSNEIPIIRTAKFEDVLFAQGYYHAQMRLWQMDFITRVAAGRISEIIGDRAIEFDKLQRRRGLAHSAEEVADKIKNYPRTLQLTQSYTDGVNYYMQHLKKKDYPIEFKILNYAPEPWSLNKCALILKYMAFVLAGRDKDIPLTNALKYFGREKFDEIYPEYNKLQSPVISSGQSYDYFEPLKIASDDTIPTSDTYISHSIIEQPSEGNGSNNWAVAGSKTESGRPILCNDPHLDLGLPSIWIQNQLICDETHAHGVSIPGVPGVVIGFNQDIAWGETNGGHDVLDWYEMQWADERKTSYWMDSSRKAVTYRYETIEVKNLPPILDTIKMTYWGPIVYEGNENDHHDLAMHWAVIDSTTTDEMGVFLNLNLAKNYEDYRNAIATFKTPLQNCVYADRIGNIAITMKGSVILKKDQQGRFVQNGNTRKNDWKGYIPASHNPLEKNPIRQFVSSANQTSTDSTYPYYYNDGDFRHYRGRIINRLLEKEQVWTIDKMKSLQQNDFNIMAEDVLPAILLMADSLSLPPQAKDLRNSLHQWDYTYDQNSRQPIVFELLWASLYELIWDEILQNPDSINIYPPENWRTIELINEQPNYAMFDNVSTDQKESLGDLVKMAFESTAVQMDTIGTDNWGAYKNTHIDHLLKLKGFNAENIMTDGSGFTINAMKETHGPSWRFIISPGVNIEAYGIYPGGQSGNPGSPYYDNWIDKWAKGQYLSIPFSSDLNEIEGRSKRKIVFR